MQSTKEVTKEVLWRGSVSWLGYGIQNEYQEELKTVGNQYLPLVFEDDMIIRHTPCRGIVLQGLRGSARNRGTEHQTDSIQQRAQH